MAPQPQKPRNHKMVEVEVAGCHETITLQLDLIVSSRERPGLFPTAQFFSFMSCGPVVPSPGTPVSTHSNPAVSDGQLALVANEVHRKPRSQLQRFRVQ